MIAVTIAGPVEWVLGIAAFVTAVVTIVQVLNKWVVAPSARQLREVIREEVSPLREEVAAVQSQLLANGGTTLRDAVNRIEHRQTKLEGEMQVVLGFVRPDRNEET